MLGEQLFGILTKTCYFFSLYHYLCAVLNGRARRLIILKVFPSIVVFITETCIMFFKVGRTQIELRRLIIIRNKFVKEYDFYWQDRKPQQKTYYVDLIFSATRLVMFMRFCLFLELFCGVLSSLPLNSDSTEKNIYIYSNVLFSGASFIHKNESSTSRISIRCSGIDLSHQLSKGKAQHS